MFYNEFVENAVKALKRHLPSELNHIVLQSTSALYNNNIYRQGIQLSEKKSKSMTRKVFIDLRDFHQSYQRGTPMETVLDDIAQHVAEIYATGLPVSVREMPYEWAKEHLLVEVCNEKMNRSQLLQMPHVKKGDLALRYLLCMDDNGANNSAWVDNELLEQWGITDEILQKDAWENMKKKVPPVVLPVSEEIMLNLDEESKKMVADQITDIQENLPYVISNTERYHGASYMFDREFMANLAERFKDDLVILPSSVHELLFLRKQEVTDIEELVAMVTEINYTHVLPEDVLSNSVYVYDRTVQNIGSFRLEQFEI